MAIKDKQAKARDCLQWRKILLEPRSTRTVPLEEEKKKEEEEEEEKKKKKK
jgi:hypothetical protein